MQVFPPVLRHRDFRSYVICNFFALNGVWMQRVALSWLGWEVTGQASFVGLLAFLTLVPTFVSGPIFGVMADRVELKRATLTVQSLLAGVASLLAGSVMLGWATPPVLAAFALAVGIVTSAHHPLRLALTPRLVPRAEIGEAVPIVSINFNLSRFLGPFFAGALIATAGAGAALVVTAISFLPLLLVLRTLHPRERSGGGAPALPVLRSLLEGIDHTRRDALVRRGMLLTAVAALAGRGVQELLPVIADGAFGQGAAGLGQLTAAAGLGALLVSISIARNPVRSADQLPTRAIVGAWCSMLIVALLSIAPSWPVAVVLIAGLGAAGTLVGVSTQSAIQMRLDDTLRGRVMSLWIMLSIGSMALGAVALGALVDVVGLKAALWIGAGVTAVALVPLSRR